MWAQHAMKHPATLLVCIIKMLEVTADVNIRGLGLLRRCCRMKLHKALVVLPQQPAVKVTIVTGLNPSRVNQLESQCKSYKGPISASVYVVLHNPNKEPALTDEHKQQLEEAAKVLDFFHTR